MTKTEKLQALAGNGCLVYYGSKWCDSDDCSFSKVRVRGWWSADYPSGQTYGATYAPTFLGANFNEAEEGLRWSPYDVRWSWR